MSSDIEKLTVMDPRIVQSRPKYAVEKGALSVTNAPFAAIAASSSQHTYNVYVPSENVFVDRKLLWSSTVNMALPVAVLAPPGQVYGQPIAVPGRDFALAALPLNQLCSTISATINDTTSVINSQDVLNPILRLTDYKKNRLIRTAPTMLDKYQSYDDAYGTLNNPIGAYNDSTDYDNVPNGAFPNLFFTTGAGVILSGSTAPGTPAFAGATYGLLNGVPVYDPALAPAVVGGVQSYTLFVQWRTTEPICLSPFIFSDEHEWETGLFGLNNIQIIMNFKSSPASLIRSCSRAGVFVGPATYNTVIGAASVFQNSFLNVTFLTPSLDVPLPPKSVVPYMEFPRYITQGASNGQAINPGQTGQIQSQTITLPQIPDLLIIYVKPSVVNPCDGDFYLPLATRAADNIANPVNFNFDNFSGLLSSVTTEQLYQMSIHNGLEMDYANWIGQGKSSAASWSTPATAPFYAANRTQGQTVALNGGILVLKPSTDITLQSGQAPSLVGNFSLQFSITVRNNTLVAQQPSLYVITANSGFFESIRGSSRIIKGVLSEQDIISAPMASMVTRTELDRLVGAGRSFRSLGNVAHHMKGMTSGAGPSAGMAGCGKTGGASGGGNSGRGKSGLSARLM